MPRLERQRQGTVRLRARLGDLKWRSEWVSLGVDRDNLMRPERVVTVCIS